MKVFLLLSVFLFDQLFKSFGADKTNIIEKKNLAILAFHYTNELRKQHDLSACNWSEILYNTILPHSRAMAEINQISHDGW